MGKVIKVETRKHLNLKENPFPFVDEDGSTIINEVCVCGRMRTEHNNTQFVFGHGPLIENDCTGFRHKCDVTGRNIKFEE